MRGDDPLRPFIVRVSVNATRAERLERVAREQRIAASDEVLGGRRSWHLELSMLPHETLALVPFLAGFVRAHEEGDASLITEPAVPLLHWRTEPLDWNHAWSKSAWTISSDYDERRLNRGGRASPRRRAPRFERAAMERAPTTNTSPTTTAQPAPTTERAAARAASWLIDGTDAPRWTRMATEVLYAERYAGALFRAFLAVLAVRLRRPTARVSPVGLCWRTRGGRLEHLRCEPYLVPSELEPRRPFLVRVVVNKGPVEDVELVARDRGLLADDAEPRPPLWSLELVLLPGELLRFAPYLVELVRAFEADGDDDEEIVVEPPTPTTFVEEHDGLWATRTLYEWSERARAVLEARAWQGARVPASVAAAALTNQRRSARR